MALSTADRTQLHQAIVEYLESHQMPEAAVAVKDATEKHGTFSDRRTTLESRWSSLLRLNRSLSATEERCKALAAQVEELQDPTKRVSTMKALLPREPSRITFQGHKDTITCVAFSPMDNVCYSASEDGTVRTWDLQSRICTSTIRMSDSTTCVAADPIKGDRVALGCADQTIRIAQDEDLVMTLRGHDTAVTSLCWIDGTYLVSGSRDGAVKAWNTQRGVDECSVTVDGFVRCVAATSLHLVAAASEEMVYLLNLKSGATIKRLGPLGVLQTVALSTFEVDTQLVEIIGTTEQKAAMKLAGRQRQAATAKGDALPPHEPLYAVTGGRDKNVTLYDVTSGAPVHTFKVHQNWVRGAMFARTGKHLITCSDDGTVCVIDIATRKPTRVIHAHDHFVTCFAMHPTRAVMATGSADHAVKLWPCE